MDRAIKQQWLAHCARLERHGDSVRLLRELALQGSFAETRRQLEMVEREGLLTDALLETLASNPKVPRKVSSLLRSRREQPLSVQPAAAGRVWVPYIAEGGETSFVVPMTCSVERDGVPALVTRRTSLWEPRLGVIVGALTEALRDRQPNASWDWSAGRVQFDLDDERLGGALDPSDRSYELAALIALVSATFGRSLVAGTAAIGILTQNDQDARGAITREIDSVGFESLRTKITGLLHALPILSHLIVPVMDVDVARRLLARTKVEIIGVETIEDVLVIAGGRAEDFRGGVRDKAISRLGRWSLNLGRRLPGMQRKEEVKEEVFQMNNDLEIARAVSGSGIGTLGGFIAATACVSYAIDSSWPHPLGAAFMIFTGTLMGEYILWTSTEDLFGTWLPSSYAVAWIASIAFCCFWLFWPLLWLVGRAAIFSGHPVERVFAVALLAFAGIAVSPNILSRTLHRLGRVDQSAFWQAFLRSNSICFATSLLIALLAPMRPLYHLFAVALAFSAAATCWHVPRKVVFRHLAYMFNIFALCIATCTMIIMFLHADEWLDRIRGRASEFPEWVREFEKHVSALQGGLSVALVMMSAYVVAKALLVSCSPLRLVDTGLSIASRASVQDLTPLDPSVGDVFVPLIAVDNARSSEVEDRA